MTDMNDVSENNNSQPRSVKQLLCFALYSTSLAMTRLYQPHLKPLGLTYTQYLTLLTLWEKDGLTVSETGQRLQLNSATLTKLLKRLEQAGLITRIRDTVHDERRVIIRLTEAGREMESRAAGVPVAIITEMGVPYETVTSLRDGLKQLQEKIVQALP
ncbi:MarR family winged helix-turn-helix transcriptional regulator [Pantoea vagans]|uniref:MarR family winged helix-turn-helix transcriptional regulator n=1 Tax=Pantoea vagans TaxID=470934 RepID=UPI0035E3E106